MQSFSNNQSLIYNLYSTQGAYYHLLEKTRLGKQDVQFQQFKKNFLRDRNDGEWNFPSFIQCRFFRTRVPFGQRHNLVRRVLRLLGQRSAVRRQGGTLGYWNFYRRNPAVIGSQFCYSKQPIIIIIIIIIIKILLIIIKSYFKHSASVSPARRPPAVQECTDQTPGSSKFSRDFDGIRPIQTFWKYSIILKIAKRCRDVFWFCN